MLSYIFARRPKALQLAVTPSRSCSQIVSRARRQQQIKESDQLCGEVMRQAQFMLFHKGKPLLFKAATGMPFRLTSYDQVARLVPDVRNEAVFMRLIQPDDAPLFAAMLPKDADPEQIQSELHAKFVDMRAALFLVQPEWSGLMSGASSLLRWLRNAKYCWSCKSRLHRNASGNQLKCSNAECASIFYPPTSPVGISLIASHDHSKALLIRQAIYPPGMHSCVAGFVDPGESLFDCVAREAAEEAGVEIDAGSLQFVDSNHWPNPAGSLMLGTIVTTRTTAPSPCTNEIEAVRWFTPAELKQALAVVDANPRLRFDLAKDPSVLFVPPKGAIANEIIRSWLKKYHSE